MFLLQSLVQCMLTLSLMRSLGRVSSCGNPGRGKSSESSFNHVFCCNVDSMFVHSTKTLGYSLSSIWLIHTTSELARFVAAQTFCGASGSEIFLCTRMQRSVQHSQMKRAETQAFVLLWKFSSQLDLTSRSRLLRIRIGAHKELFAGR